MWWLEGAGAGGHCAPLWAYRVGAFDGAKLSKPPSHPPQHMLDYLWQRNFRQFIYKVGMTRPGHPLPTPPLPVNPRSHPWTGCPLEHHPQCSTPG